MVSSLAVSFAFLFHRHTLLWHRRKEMKKMQAVEQTIISKNDPRYGVIDAPAFAAKNLYNLVLYKVRQSFILDGVYLVAESAVAVGHEPPVEEPEGLRVAVFGWRFASVIMSSLGIQSHRQ